MHRGRLRFQERDASRADWMELFFDLVFVALIGQLSAGPRTTPTFAALGIFLALFASVWWSWVNLTFTVNIQVGMSRRALAGFMLAAMAAVGVIAVAAPEAVGDRAWLFALGNAALRAIMLGLWVRNSWGTGVGSRIRVLAYNGGTGIIWLVSAFVPSPARFVLWAVAIAIEIVLLFVSAPGLLRRIGAINVEHLADRFGTLVIIALGESVLAIVIAVSTSFTPMSALAGLFALVITAGLAWAMFMFGIDAMRTGLGQLVARSDARGVVETVAFLPFLLVAGVMMLAGAVSLAIDAPAVPLPASAAAALGGGVILFYATNAAISLRYGTPWRTVLPWAIPAIILPLAVGFLALVVPAVWAAAAMAVVIAGIVTLSEVRARALDAAS
ncbi:low temperature requirement protein A [Microbacterium sp. ASV49]|uniref:Low temperature requirement protein A n=1 Tax=Microbacterium candidum TaxID=3041922 RepID=A0ABT7MTZ2_9MICO|nr:low temperature requirement protein A [Microbacterium sp. ASV49]MDL9977916.1 low temperature requirement protein A [Microbacterium sp. ASV49]